ncbi:helix-turn-helix domain-containing protein, partial [Acinetobacter pittii]
MARISINKASQEFNVSRNTLYKYIKQGKLTKDENGKLDSSDLIRLFSVHVNGQPINEQNIVNDKQEYDQLKQENEQLKQQLLMHEMRINELKMQLDYVKANEQWLKQQLDQKL